MIKISLCGTGSALPALRKSSDAFDRELGLSEGFLQAASGVRTRPVASGEEDQMSLAEAAARAALTAAGIGPEALSLVIGGSAVPYQPLPATAPLLAARLGIADGQLAAFDVNSSCLSFVTAWEVAARLLAPGQYALIFASELASRALPWAAQPEVAALFGDGAAAAVLQAGGEGCLRASLLRSYPSAAEACEIGSGGTRFDFHNDRETFARHAFFRMEGRELFRLTARHFRGFTAELLERAGWERPDLVVAHQASPAGLAHMIRLCGFDADIVPDFTADYGNQIAASIPVVLDHMRRQGRVKAGAKVLILGTSAGVSFGGLAFEA